MTKLSSSEPLKKFWFRKSPTAQTSIVPAGDVSGQALVVVIAIMTFLASLAIGGVDLIGHSAHNWENQVSREATIQIRPTDGLDIEKTLKYAVELAKSFRGVKSAEIVDRTQTERLLEPWLGTGLELNDLPIPRLIVVTLDDSVPVDFGMISDAIATQIPGGSFDDHRNAISRLVTMAHATIIIGLVILALVISALTLTIIFATRSALSANQHIVEVLHFIGAESSFIARQFDLHFFKTGFKGACYGGLSAIIVFIAFSFWSGFVSGTPGGDQTSALFGHFSLGLSSYIKIFILVSFVSLLTMMTSRLTILSQLKSIDRSESELF
ncbi:cell division transport system permease protein [Bartonella apihabitans]|uniref:cell division protein FtsX n=1 Tax=Bartonella apihabitans TaxID=2750929 RepID=UPI00098FB3C8|nr:ABC transporter permease [Bartonella apihabitans]AQT45850.1 cell division transport system permease protein [Bartonella apihabitans]